LIVGPPTHTVVRLDVNSDGFCAQRVSGEQGGGGGT
jgi:hypothetical protein